MESQNNTIFYTHHHQRPSSALGNLYLHPHNDSHELEQVFISTKITTTAAKEPIFQKTLTPSDVGKLNRLVLPKRHAEKYFPLLLRVGGTTDQQKGLFLTFEDEFGKLWRFWYWKSSKSYVLTKGWNQYVHEKRLEAGDHIFFECYRLDSNCKRIFIGWRRQSAAVAPINDRMAEEMAQPITEISRSSYMFHHALSCYPSHHWPISIYLPYQTDPSGADAGDENENVVNYKTGVGATRRLRLFGVDLECPNDSESYSGQSDHQYRLRLQQSPSRQG